jgi:hypothetical protein
MHASLGGATKRGNIGRPARFGRRLEAAIRTSEAKKFYGRVDLKMFFL